MSGLGVRDVSTEKLHGLTVFYQIHFPRSGFLENRLTGRFPGGCSWEPCRGEKRAELGRGRSQTVKQQRQRPGGLLRVVALLFSPRFQQSLDSSGLGRNLHLGGGCCPQPRRGLGEMLPRVLSGPHSHPARPARRRSSHTSPGHAPSPRPGLQEQWAWASFSWGSCLLGPPQGITDTKLPPLTPGAFPSPSAIPFAAPQGECPAKPQVRPGALHSHPPVTTPFIPE